MYYMMLCHAEELEQIYMEMPKLKNKEEELKLVIKDNPHSSQVNEDLVSRSIVKNFKSNHYR